MLPAKTEGATPSLIRTLFNLTWGIAWPPSTTWTIPSLAFQTPITSQTLRMHVAESSRLVRFDAAIHTTSIRHRRHDSAKVNYNGASKIKHDLVVRHESPSHVMGSHWPTSLPWADHGVVMTAWFPDGSR